jgi:hypothetical protein
MDDIVKIIRDMIEDDGALTYRGYMLFKSAVDDKGFCVGQVPENFEHFEPTRYFGFDIVSAIQYLYENGGKE